MKIFLGTDHNGYSYKQELLNYLRLGEHEVVDLNEVLDPNDYFPQFASRVCNALLQEDPGDSRGLLICGSGQGMVMAANRFKGIRASLCFSPEEARAARNDDNSNVLCLAANFTDDEEAKKIINVFLLTPFAKAPRFIRRLKELDELN